MLRDNGACIKPKVRKRYVLKIFGFPIVLTNIPLVKLIGEWMFDINYFELERTVLRLLCQKKAPLTGNEIRFIRKFCGMTLAEFGAVFGWSDVAALKWERAWNRWPKMELAIDLCIRFFVFEKLHCNAKSFKKLYESVRLQELAKIRKERTASVSSPLSIDMGEDLKAVVNW